MKAQDLQIDGYYQASIEFNGSASATLCFNEKRVFKMTKENLILLLQLGLESFIKPITLTEQWQLKFGKQDNYYKGIVIEIKLISGREARFIFQKSGNLILHDGRKNIVIGVIEYVHQFQNIYKALTNEELTLKGEITK